MVIAEPLSSASVAVSYAICRSTSSPSSLSRAVLTAIPIAAFSDALSSRQAASLNSVMAAPYLSQELRQRRPLTCQCRVEQAGGLLGSLSLRAVIGGLRLASKAACALARRLSTSTST